MNALARPAANAATKRSGSPVPTGWREPQTSDALRLSINDILEGRAGWPVPTYSDPLRAEAAAQLRELESALMPVDRDVIREWMKMIAASVGNSPTKEDFDARVIAAQEMLGDLPAVCWTRETQREVTRHPCCRFMPSISDLDAILRPKARELGFRRIALEKVVSGAPRKPEPPRDEPEELTPEQREEVYAWFNAVKARYPTRRQPILEEEDL